jgi:putative peptide zinc metalloprotease protein
VVDLDIPGAVLERVGARVEVRFDLGFEPLAQQLWRRLRQTFLSHLSHTG